MGSIPGSGRSAGGRHGNLLQYSCLENLMDRRTCQAMIHKVAKSRVQLKQLSMHTQSHTEITISPVLSSVCECIFLQKYLATLNFVKSLSTKSVGIDIKLKSIISSSQGFPQEEKNIFYNWKNTSIFRQICTRDYNPLSFPTIAQTTLCTRKLFEQPQIRNYKSGSSRVV